MSMPLWAGHCDTQLAKSLRYYYAFRARRKIVTAQFAETARIDQYWLSASLLVISDDAFTRTCYMYGRRGQLICTLKSLLAITFLRLDVDKKDSSRTACFPMSEKIT
eukprot:scaffold180837_cov17-Prasinocladus_malaysianus.AAC.1